MTMFFSHFISLSDSFSTVKFLISKAGYCVACVKQNLQRLTIYVLPIRKITIRIGLNPAWHIYIPRGNPTKEQKHHELPAKFRHRRNLRAVAPARKPDPPTRHAHTYLLARLLEDSDELPGALGVLRREEADGGALVPGTPTPTDPVDV